MEYIEDNPDTLLIVTADHETGGLQDNLDIEEGIINYYKFTTTGHSDQEVFYFMYGHGAETVPANIDNTDIAKLIFRALG
jgi:alkaline phosphatase